MTKPRVKLINSKPFQTDKVQSIFELNLPEIEPFNQNKYIHVWLDSYTKFLQGYLTIEELIQIGEILQTRQLPKGESLGSFTYKPFFDLLEYTSEIIYKYSEDRENLNWVEIRKKIDEYAEELRKFKA